jgi:aconitate hydratase
VLAKSFARIHRANLVNFGILPLTFVDAADYDRIAQGDVLEMANLRSTLSVDRPLRVRNVTQSYEFDVRHDLSSRQAEVVLAGGRLSHVQSMQA